MMKHKKKAWKYGFLICTIASIIAWAVLYICLWGTIYKLLATFYFGWFFVVICLARILLLGLFSYYLLKRWLKQDSIYTSDAYFLFGIFFFIYTQGKIMDLIYAILIASEAMFPFLNLLLFKIRYLIISFAVISLMYIGLEALKIFIVLLRKKDISKRTGEMMKKTIVWLYLIGVSLLIMLAPSVKALNSYYPYLSMAVFVLLFFMFIFMYKNKRLSQAHGLIIGLSFLLMIVTSLVRSILTFSAFEEVNAVPLIFAEIFDMLVNSLMYYGFVTKPNFKK